MVIGDCRHQRHKLVDVVGGLSAQPVDDVHVSPGVVPWSWSLSTNVWAEARSS